MLVGHRVGDFRLGCTCINGFTTPQTRGATEDDQIDQRVRAETVGAVDRNAGGFADSHETGNNRVRVAIGLGEHFAVIIGRDATHIVVNGWQNRDRVLGDVHA